MSFARRPACCSAAKKRHVDTCGSRVLSTISRGPLFSNSGQLSARRVRTRLPTGQRPHQHQHQQCLVLRAPHGHHAWSVRKVSNALGVVAFLVHGVCNTPRKLTIHNRVEVSKTSTFCDRQRQPTVRSLRAGVTVSVFASEPYTPCYWALSSSSMKRSQQSTSDSCHNTKTDGKPSVG